MSEQTSFLQTKNLIKVSFHEFPSNRLNKPSETIKICSNCPPTRTTCLNDMSDQTCLSDMSLCVGTYRRFSSDFHLNKLSETIKIWSNCPPTRTTCRNDMFDQTCLSDMSLCVGRALVFHALIRFCILQLISMFYLPYWVYYTLIGFQNFGCLLRL